MLHNLQNKDVIRAFEPFITRRNVKVLGFGRWDKYDQTWIYFMFGKKLLCACFDEDIMSIAVYGEIDIDIMYNSATDNFYTADGSVRLQIGAECNPLSESGLQKLKEKLNSICNGVEVYQI
jgi:hypothetical protein